MLTHNLTNSGVPAGAVADAIAAAITADEPPLRHVIGDADVLAAMRERHHDDDLLGVYFLDGDEFRDRYRQLSGIDYWP